MSARGQDKNRSGSGSSMESQDISFCRSSPPFSPPSEADSSSLFDSEFGACGFDFSSINPHEVSEASLLSPNDAVKLTPKDFLLDFDFQRMIIKEEAEAAFSDISGSDMWDMIETDSKLGGMNTENELVTAATTRATDAVLNENRIEQDDIFQMALYKHPAVICRSCDNENRINMLTRVKDCGCILCTPCIINSALHSRRRGPKAYFDVLCPGCPGKRQDPGAVGGEGGLRQGIIGRQELEKTLSPALYQEITEPLKAKCERAQKKIYECEISDCPGFCVVTKRQSFFRCPICKTTSNCFRCGVKHGNSLCPITSNVTPPAAAAPRRQYPILQPKRKTPKVTSIPSTSDTK